MQVNTGAPTVGTGRRRVDFSPIFCFFFFSVEKTSRLIFSQGLLSGIFEFFFVHHCRFLLKM